MWSFCSAKASLIFSTKNISVFGYKVVKHLTSWPLNELVKLMMLWTTGPWCTVIISALISLTAVLSLYNSHPWDSKKLVVVGRWLLWRGQIYSKTALWRYWKLAVLGRWLLLGGDHSWKFHCRWQKAWPNSRHPNKTDHILSNEWRQ